MVRSTYWWGEAKSVNDLFPGGEKAFKTVTWAEFRKMPYAVLTYGWATITWSDIIAVLTKANMTVPYVWIDIFCNSQCDPQPPSTMRVVERSPAIYGGAKEYHVFGMHVVSRGWCTCELASARNPILHGASELPSDGLAHKVEKQRVVDVGQRYLGFEKAEFYDESDRSTVRDMINTLTFSVKNFDSEMARFFLDFGKRNLIAEETHAVIAAAVNAVLNPWRAPDSVVLALADALDGGSSRFREQEGGDREPSVLDEVQRASVIRTLEDSLGHAIAAYAAQREGENVADAGKILATALRAMWCVGPGV